MRTVCAISLRVLALVFACGLFTGCEDQEARNKAVSASKELGELKEELGRLKTELTDAKGQISTLRGSVEKAINTRMDSLDEKVVAAEKKLRDEFMAASETASKSMQGRINAVQSDFDGRLKNLLQVDWAKTMQDLRQDIAKNREELLGFMDKQLKELYPYAYQPRRVEPNQPPAAPQP